MKPSGEKNGKAWGVQTWRGTTAAEESRIRGTLKKEWQLVAPDKWEEEFDQRAQLRQQRIDEIAAAEAEAAAAEAAAAAAEAEAEAAAAAEAEAEGEEAEEGGKETE